MYVLYTKQIKSKDKEITHMIKSTEAYKLSVIIEGIKSGNLNGKVVLNIKPTNRSDSVNVKGNHMKFDAASREYYLEIKQGTKKSFDSNFVSIRHIGRILDNKGSDMFLDDTFESLLNDALSYVNSNQKDTLEQKMRAEYMREKRERSRT